MPDTGITTDILIGFPGESDGYFSKTVDLIKDILPVRVHIFPFSKREGTAANSMDHVVPDMEIKKRFQKMKVAATMASYLFRERFLGRVVEVLVESKRDKHSGRLTGYTDNYIKVMFDGPDSIMKTIAPVKIEELGLIYTLGSYLTRLDSAGNPSL